MAQGRQGAFYSIGSATLEGRLTSARADLLDRLAILAAGGAGELTPANAALLARLAIIAAGGAGEFTPTRAALLANLDRAISALKQAITYDARLEWVNPALNAVGLDTGALAAGNYEVWAVCFQIPNNTAVVTGISVARRNAANAADVAPHIKTLVDSRVAANSQAGYMYWPHVPLLVNERFVIRNDGAALTGSWWVNLIVRPV